MSQDQRSKVKVKVSKVPITSSVIVTDISIKPQQFPTSSLELYATAFSLP